MPGTLIRDANVIELFDGATLNAAGTTSGTVKQIESPGEVAFILATDGTISSTGNSATLNVEVKGADNLAFDSGVVSYGRFAALSGTDDAQESLTRVLNAYVDKKYVRATVIVGGTSPVYTGATLHVRLPHDRRTRSTTA